MIKIEEKIKCSGCSACYNVCPVNAITMEDDEEGFWYPKIDPSKCVRCDKCEKVCPYINKITAESDLQMCFAAYNKSEEERFISSSGGMFIALAKEILQEGGVVFGAAYDERYMVCHMAAENEKQLIELIGSKYLQSRIGTIYQEVHAQVKLGRKVLFVGCSCQISGLISFLGQNYDNLVCVDFICLGVPSPKVWSDYLDTFFIRDKINFVNFKDKSLGWHTFSLRINSDDEEFVRNGRETHFFSGFFKALYSRPSCSACIFKQGKRLSDITISDCWGYRKIAPEMDDNKGLSSVVIHTEKGRQLFFRVKEQVVYKEANLEDILKYNRNYNTSAAMGEQRAEFWADYNRLSKKEVFEKWCSG
ncbi:MAG: Coenzyme F420 hydrogenase/dehydrogenase, beta subunit C-terminal domain [Acetatifactor sp.]|nr:Coenzyme F420 hydrogenase/dehydrogenase, beta subunit C-terminal domain [Acetatifactor sp.]